MSSNPQSSLSALEHFKRFSDKINAVISDADKAAGALGSLKEQLDPAFQAARRQLNASRLNLVIIGAEGHGKSTFINAVLGAELSPRERIHPGTVAPTHLEFGENSEPAYFVEIKGKGRQRCNNFQEFRRFVLQEYNPDNKAGVLSGHVHVNHPMLRNGICLVDMPGVGGVSQEVRQAATEFIKAKALAVIGIVKDRQYGELRRVLENFPSTENRLHGVIVNVSSEFFKEDGDALELSQVIQEQRAAAAKHLSSASIKITEDKIFVLHLPSRCDVHAGKTPTVNLPEHQQEAASFDRHLWDYVRTNGSREVLRDACGHAEQLLGTLRGRLGVRRDILRALLGGNPALRTEITQTFAAARLAAAAAWEPFVSEQNAKALSAQEWPSVRQVVVSVRDELLDEICKIERDVERTTQQGKITTEMANKYHSELQTKLSAEMGRLKTAQEAGQTRMIRYYCAKANDLLRDLFHKVPVLAASVDQQRVRITEADFLEWELGKMEPGLAEQLLKYGSVGTAAIVAGNLCGGSGIALLSGVLFLGPVGALLAGGVLGGAAVYGLYNLLRDENLPAVLRELKKSRDAIQKLDSGDTGPLCIEWDKSALSIAKRVDLFLGEQFEGFRRLIYVGDDQVALHSLRSEADSMERAIGTTTVLSKTLIEIRAQAGSDA